MSLHIGYGGAVKKVKAIYAGVGGAVKKVKAVYGGVSNAVKLLWRGDVLERASAPAMTEGKYEPAAAAAGDYAVVLGGGTGSNFRTEDTATAEAYTAELVHVADVASLPEPGEFPTRRQPGIMPYLPEASGEPGTALRRANSKTTPTPMITI